MFPIECGFSLQVSYISNGFQDIPNIFFLQKNMGRGLWIYCDSDHNPHARTSQPWFVVCGFIFDFNYNTHARISQDYPN